MNEKAWALWILWRLSSYIAYKMHIEIPKENDLLEYSKSNGEMSEEMDLLQWRIATV